jgi:hypothetical protein
MMTPGSVRHPFQKLAAETLGGFSIALRLYQDVEQKHPDNCPPEIVVLTLDGGHRLIQMPFISSSGLPSSKCIGIILPKLCPTKSQPFSQLDSTKKRFSVET